MTRSAAWTRSAFEAAYQALVLREIDDNVGCVASVRCFACCDSTFCKDSQGLVRCHYTTRSTFCSHCAHCSRCDECVACSHCVDCTRCIRSAYLFHSTGCVECHFCFGCVGLRSRDFLILNEPYDRSTYFEIVRRLMQELRIEP